MTYRSDREIYVQFSVSGWDTERKMWNRVRAHRTVDLGECSAICVCVDSAIGRKRDIILFCRTWGFNDPVSIFSIRNKDIRDGLSSLGLEYLQLWV